MNRKIKVEDKKINIELEDFLLLMFFFGLNVFFILPLLIIIDIGNLTTLL
jgi:hypothetical protein